MIRPARPFRFFQIGGGVFPVGTFRFYLKTGKRKYKKAISISPVFLTETTNRPFWAQKKRDRFLGLSLGVNHDGVVLVMGGNFSRITPIC